MATQQKQRVWDWRTTILKHGPKNSTYRHVLLTLSCYMNSAGGSCFPSYDTLQEATQLGRATLAKYLKKAAKDGWLKIDKHGFGGQKWSRNDYQAEVPDSVWKEIHNAKGSSPDEPPNDEGSSPDEEGSSPDEEKAVQEPNSNSPSTSASNSTGVRASDSAQDKTPNGNSVPNDQGTPIDEAQAIWEDVCDVKPDAATAMTLQGSLATCDVEWQPKAFRKALKTAYRNVSLDAGRIRVGYLMDSYEREAARMEDKANPASYDVADNSALDRLEDRWGN